MIPVNRVRMVERRSGTRCPAISVDLGRIISKVMQRELEYRWGIDPVMTVNELRLPSWVPFRC